MSINVQINTDEVQRSTDVTILCKMGNGLTVTTQGEYEVAAGILTQVKNRYKELDGQRKEITKPIDTAKKSVMDMFRVPLGLLEKAESSIKRMMINYTEEQERIAREEQLKLQRLAEKEAEAERKRIQAQIERAQASGKTEKAEALQEKIEAVEVIEVPVIAPVIETPKGVSFREQWSVLVVDANLIPREYMLPNLPKLNKIAQATKGSIVIPGVKFHSEKILSSRG